MEPETFTAYIYQIYDHWEGLRYVGSTTKSVNHRLKGHEMAYTQYKRLGTKFMTSFNVLCNGDYDISILERVEVKSLKELRKIEGKYIAAIDCVNLRVAGQTTKEYYTANKQALMMTKKAHYEANKEAVKQQRRVYYKANHDKLLEKAKAYRDLNKDAIAIKYKVYHEANKHIKAAQQSKKMTCECGSIFRQGEKARHFRSQKHIEYLNSL